MIDEDFRVWLIEVNSNPYLGVPNKFIEGLLPKMLNDMLEIVCDPICKPVNPLPKRDLCNQFELLYNEKKKISQRRGFNIGIYPLSALSPSRRLQESPLLKFTLKARIDEKPRHPVKPFLHTRKTYPEKILRSIPSVEGRKNKLREEKSYFNADRIREERKRSSLNSINKLKKRIIPVRKLITAN